MKRILCVMSDVGGTHRAVASAVGEALCRLYPDMFSYEIVDIYSISSRFCNFLVKLYPHLVRHCPEVYNFIYRLTDSARVWGFGYSSLLLPLMKRKVKGFIRRKQPDLIISVFALSSRIVADALHELRLLGKLPLVVVVVDLFTIHRSWAEPRADLFIVPTEEAKAQLLGYGVTEEKLQVAGFPINPRFSDRKPQKSIKTELGLEEKFTVMVMGGGDGVGDIYRITESLIESGMDIQVITVAGRNGRLLRKLEGLKGKELKVFGYTDRISDLMDASDVLITKAGPGTLMEAISKELPVIITGRTLNQEIGNVEFIKSKRLGWVASGRWEAVEYLREIFEHSDEGFHPHPDPYPSPRPSPSRGEGEDREREEMLNEIRGNIRNVKETGGTMKIARLIKDMVRSNDFSR